jgi:hypothetical protein
VSSDKSIPLSRICWHKNYLNAVHNSNISLLQWNKHILWMHSIYGHLFKTNLMLLPTTDKVTAWYLNNIKLWSSVFHRRSNHLTTYPSYDLLDQLFGTGSHIAEITTIRKHGSHCHKSLRKQTWTYSSFLFEDHTNRFKPANKYTSSLTYNILFPICTSRITA